MKKLLMTILLVVVFIFLAGCAPTGSGNSGEDVVGSFEWARKIAEEVRDAELPDAPCYSITSYSVDNTGIIDEDSTWQLSFEQTEGEDYGLTVAVYYNGETEVGHYSDYNRTELPHYSNGKVSTWFNIADEAVNEGSLNYDRRWFVCVDDASNSFEGVEFVAAIAYIHDTQGYVAMVVMDANTGEVLEAEVY